MKKTAEDSGRKSFSLYCAGETTEKAKGQESDVLKQAKDDWDHSAIQLGHDWDVAGDQLEACFADHVTNPLDIPVGYHGNDSTTSRVGPNGADTVAVKRVDTYTFTATLKKAGKAVQASRVVVSKDGKVTTITGKGTDEQGQPKSSSAVWEKQ